MTQPIETSPAQTIQVDPSDVYRLMAFREVFEEEFKLLSLAWKYGLKMDPYILTTLANGGKQFLRIVSTLKESIVTPWIRSIFTALEVSLKKFVRYLRIVKYFGRLALIILAHRIAEQLNKAVNLLRELFRAFRAIPA
ncbi:MAG: hypothetical protein RXR13_04025 [Sulfolobaceae archaeon]|jgi:hypothetical protein|nr:hypothetical protein [Sulfolobales archaeon]MCQ4407193.1 hypothetical protein [Sulfolobales archaeon]MCQ4448960.1 hypothetical protein [Sulfolobales archaeon]